MKKSIIVVAVVSHLFFGQSQAQESVEYKEPRDAFDLVISMAFTIGGDNLSEVEYDNGDDGEIEAGGGLLFGVGSVYHVPNKPIEVQATFNYYFDNEDAKNGNTEFVRMPLELLIFYKMEKHRLGAGLTYHLNPEFEFKMDGEPSFESEYDNALGLILEYNYMFSQRSAFGIRVTSIEYDISSATLGHQSMPRSLLGDIDAVSGNNFGLTMHGFF